MPPLAEEYGYIRVSRKLYETDPFWNEPRVFSRHEAWEDFIQMAAWKDHTRLIANEVVELKRGELLVSRSFLAQRWKWGEKKVRLWIDLVSKWGRIRAERRASAGVVYRLVNYDDYQAPLPERAGGGAGKGASEGPSEGQRRAGREVTKKEGNKGNKEYSEEFDAAWVEYPVRAGSNSKADAFRAWSARLKEGATANEMMAGVKRYAAFCFHTDKLRSEYVMQGKRFFGPTGQFREPWTIPDGTRGVKPGSEAAGVRNERPQAEASRVGRPTPVGADPAEEQRKREAEEDERIQHWRRSNPEEVKRLAAELRQEMEDDPRWHGTPAAIIQAAAGAELRRRILARLGPRAA